MGYFQAQPATMKKFRDRLDANPAEFVRIAKKLKKEKDFELTGDEYSRKKGDKDGIPDEWYNRKNISMIAEHGGHEAVYSPEFTNTLCSAFHKLVPALQLSFGPWKVTSRNGHQYTDCLKRRRSGFLDKLRFSRCGACKVRETMIFES